MFVRFCTLINKRIAKSASGGIWTHAYSSSSEERAVVRPVVGGMRGDVGLPSMQCASEDGGRRRGGCGDAKRRDCDAPEDAAAQSRHLVRHTGPLTRVRSPIQRVMNSSNNVTTSASIHAHAYTSDNTQQ